MNLKTIEHVCSRLVYAFHWRNVGSKDRVNEMPLCASLAQHVGIDATDLAPCYLPPFRPRR